MSETLTANLREERTRTLIRQAEIIRDHPESSERTEQAEYFVREAMMLREIGRLTLEGESRIFSLLSFVMPGDASIEGDEPPLPEQPEVDTTDEEMLEGLRCQLDRQNCPSCGEEPYQV